MRGLLVFSEYSPIILTDVFPLWSLFMPMRASGFWDTDVSVEESYATTMTRSSSLSSLCLKNVCRSVSSEPTSSNRFLYTSSVMGDVYGTGCVSIHSSIPGNVAPSVPTMYRANDRIFCAVGRSVEFIKSSSIPEERPIKSIMSIMPVRFLNATICAAFPSSKQSRLG